MNVVEATKSRKSIRGFKSLPVPKEILAEILEIAAHSPSGVNTQPWEVFVATGELLDNLRKANIEMLHKGENPVTAHYNGVFKQRQSALPTQLFRLMGIAREDREKRAQWTERGFRYFDAPVVLILCADNSLIEAMASFDIGAFCQTICLTALEHGLGTCIEAQGVYYQDVLRRYLNIPDSKRIVISIAIGYPDWDFPSNKVESTREPVGSFTTWYGFD